MTIRLTCSLTHSLATKIVRHTETGVLPPPAWGGGSAVVGTCMHGDGREMLLLPIFSPASSSSLAPTPAERG